MVITIFFVLTLIMLFHLAIFFKVNLNKLITIIKTKIGHRADKSGPRPPVRNQAGVKKYASGTNIPKNPL